MIALFAGVPILCIIFYIRIIAEREMGRIAGILRFLHNDPHLVALVVVVAGAFRLGNHIARRIGAGARLGAVSVAVGGQIERIFGGRTDIEQIVTDRVDLEPL